jgi:hypothetical protein
MPAGTVYVGRPTRWGNPYVIGASYRDPFIPSGEFVITRENCLELFEMYAKGKLAAAPTWLDPLRGKDLSCWCRLSSPCHADVLLRLANN